MGRALLLILAAAMAAVAQPRANAIVVTRPADTTVAAWKVFETRHGQFDCLISGNGVSAERLLQARVLFLDHPSPGLLERLKTPALAAIAKGLRVVSPTPEIVQRAWGIEMDLRLTRRLLPYWENGGVENMANFFAVLYAESGGPQKLAVPRAIETPRMGVYHPDAKGIFPDLASYLAWYRPAKPGRGGLAVVTFFHSNWKNRDMAVIDALLRGLERRGLAAAAVFGWPHHTTKPIYNPPQTDPVRVLLSFTLGLSRPEDREYLEKQNVHVIGLFTTRASYADWAQSPRGVPPERVATSLGEPERNGATDPILVATTETSEDGTLSRTVPIAERVDMAARRASRWVVLGDKANHEKRLVLLYYNNPPGKGNVGASYLNLTPSLRNVLDRLRRDGYRVGSKTPTVEEIQDRIQKVGRNVELWAPGELTRMLEQGGVTLLPVHRYRQWFDALPQRFRDSVNARWGPPEKAELMVWKSPEGKRYFVIPGFRMENLFVGPQILRASFAEYTNVQHSSTLPPHHGYVASYLFYRHQLQADAVIHMGRHGTLEWLPGKNAGQAGWDASEVLLGDLPNVNYYIMDGDGEALQARRRAAAVDLSHLTPMLARTGREDRLRTVSEAIANWTETRETSPALAAEYAASAWSELDRLGLTTEIPLDRAKGDAELEEAASFLEKLEDSVIPLGLPTLGESPSLLRQREAFHAFQRASLQPREALQLDKQWDGWTDRIFDGETPVLPTDMPPALRDKVNRIWEDGRQWLLRLRASATRELNELPRILQGEYLPSGLVGDPLRTPDALPSGRNLHQGDSSQWPTPAAWELGKKLARDLLEDHRQREGKYPERMSMVLWQGETGRHQGVMEAQALFLMGVEPRWNSRGAVDGLQLIPDAELGHPRVNVVFTVSGLYRDGLADKIVLLDRASRLAASGGDNAIRRQNNEVEKALLARGIAPEQAKELAAARVFATAPGSYGLGLSQFVEQSRDKEEPETMAQLYLSKMNYAFTEKSWGATAPALLENQLRGNEVIVHSRSSNLYGAVDNDDVYQWMGGLRTASAAAGANPRLVVNSLRRAGQERVEDLRVFLTAELHARNWNPKWIAEMQKEGYAGGRLMARSIENLYGWQATAPDVLSSSIWKKAYDVYVADTYGLGLREFFDKSNPAARQELVARLLEVDRQGTYKFSATERRQLVQEMARLVSKSGVACTANVCGNLRLQTAILQEARAAGVGAALSKELRRAVSGYQPAAQPAADPYRGMKVSLVKIRKVSEAARRLVTENPWVVGGTLAALGGLASVMALHLRRRRVEWSALRLGR